MRPEDFRRECAKLGITSFKDASVYADPGEMDWIAGVLGGLRIEGNSADTPASPVTYSHIRIDVGVTGRYFRGIGKIAFHYLLTQMPHLSGSEPAFAPFREMLLTDGVPDNYSPYVQESRTPILFDVQQGARLVYWGHLLCLDVDYMRIRAMVQLFIGPELLPSTFLVDIGPNPSRLHFDQVRGHFFRYFPDGRARGCDGDIEPVYGVRFRQVSPGSRVV
ncbi:MAG: hypothetical protein ACK5AZ_20290 [Bryobacteraceae bacterium]